MGTEEEPRQDGDVEGRETPLLIVISGPSGAGKTRLCDALLNRHASYRLSISATTRPPRKGEIDGREYVFLTTDEFEARKDKDEFAEWALVHGHYYGTSRHFIDESLAQGTTVVFDIDVQGSMLVRERYPEAVLVFVMPPSKKILGERLIGRQTDAPDVIETRMKNAIGEIGYMDRFDYLIVNDKFERAVDHLEAILQAERLKVTRAGSRLFLKDEA